jgi:hypothetical protein
MDKPLPRREAAEELAALIHMTRFMSDIVPKLVADSCRLKQQLDELEAELQTALRLAGAAGGVTRRAN